MMAKGRSMALWAHTSYVLCMLANVNRDPKKKPSAYRPDDFNPHEQKSDTAPPKIKMKDLKNLVPAFAELANRSGGRSTDQQVAALVEQAKSRRDRSREGTRG